MVNNSWITDVQSSIFSRIKAIGNAKFKTKYGTIKYTTNPVDIENPTFPTVYIHETSITNIGDGLERAYNSKDRYVVQIEVFANDSDRVNSKAIGNEIMNMMNTWGFIGVPITENTSNYSRTVARYEKEIHADDIF